MKDSERPNVASKAFVWWRDLTQSEDPKTRSSRRAALAHLRRAHSEIEIMMVPEALRLIKQFPRRDADSVATLAGILAFVDDSHDQPVARALGRAQIEDDSAILSEGRFRRLMQLHKDELLDPMRRLVRLAKGNVNVYDLSSSVLHWSDAVKKSWISDYYGVWQETSTRPARTSATLPQENT